SVSLRRIRPRAGQRGTEVLTGTRFSVPARISVPVLTRHATHATDATHPPPPHHRSASTCTNSTPNTPHLSSRRTPPHPQTTQQGMPRDRPRTATSAMPPPRGWRRHSDTRGRPSRNGLLTLPPCRSRVPPKPPPCTVPPDAAGVTRTVSASSAS